MQYVWYRICIENPTRLRRGGDGVEEQGRRRRRGRVRRCGRWGTSMVHGRERTATGRGRGGEETAEVRRTAGTTSFGEDGVLSVEMRKEKE